MAKCEHVCTYGVKPVFQMWVAVSFPKIQEAFHSSGKQQGATWHSLEANRIWENTQEDAHMASPFVSHWQHPCPPCCVIYCLFQMIFAYSVHGVESLACTHFFLPGGINRLMTPNALGSPCIIHTIHLLSRSQSFFKKRAAAVAACEKMSIWPLPLTQSSTVDSIQTAECGDVPFEWLQNIRGKKQPFLPNSLKIACPAPPCLPNLPEVEPFPSKLYNGICTWWKFAEPGPPPRTVMLSPFVQSHKCTSWENVISLNPSPLQ